MHLGAAIAGGPDEAHGARVRHLGLLHRAPRDELVGPVLDDLRRPFHRRAERRMRFPVGAPVVQHADRFEVGHEPGQVLEIAPESVDLLRRAVDGDRLAHPYPLPPARVPMADVIPGPGEPLARDDVQDRHPDHRGGGSGEAAMVVSTRAERSAEQRQIHGIAGHPSPRRTGAGRCRVSSPTPVAISRSPTARTGLPILSSSSIPMARATSRGARIWARPSPMLKTPSALASRSSSSDVPPLPSRRRSSAIAGSSIYLSH